MFASGAVASGIIGTIAAFALVISAGPPLTQPEVPVRCSLAPFYAGPRGPETILVGVTLADTSILLAP